MAEINGVSLEFNYFPILALSPSEMVALEELPGKDKDIILPVIPLKGWSSSIKLKNSTARIKKAIGDRPWLATIDAAFLRDNKEYQLTGVYPREVFNEISELLDSGDGYKKWFDFLSEIQEAIPVLQLGDLSELNNQISRMSSLSRGIAVVFSLSDIESGVCSGVIGALAEHNIENVYIIYDIGTIGSNYCDYILEIESLVQKASEKISGAMISVSASSFPSSFAGYENGENPIFERRLYEKIRQDMPDVHLVYSDHGSARVEKQTGGGGIPAPRIDYPLKDDWRFIRKEFMDANDVQDAEKEMLYTSIAKEISQKDYWIPELRLWGTQMIELTAQGEKYGINSPQKATAVRINIHLHNQLHYHAGGDVVDTDEDWID